MAVTRLAARNCAEAKIVGGSIGCRLRRSFTTNATKLTTPTTSDPHTLTAPQPSSPAAMSPQLTPPSASAISAAPTPSMRGSASGSSVSGTCRAATTTTNTASGRLMRKIHRHEAASTSQPPRKGPMADATPLSPDHAPMARDRSSGRKLASRMARLAGVSSAPPTPCTSRAKTRNTTVGATAHSSEPTANTTMPSWKMRLRPNRSPSDPPRRISAETDSR